LDDAARARRGYMKRAGTVLACLTLLVGVMGVAQATDSLHFLNKRLLKRRAMLAEERGARGGFLPSEVECRRSGTSQDLNLDCDDRALPNNEPHIVVDPEDPKHMIASSNDYDSCCDGFYTTFNGGRTWIQGDMSAESKNVIGSDPVTTIDPKSGNAIHSSLNFGVTQEGLAVDGDVVASISRDGGVTWREPVVVQHGSGDDDDPVQLFNDKEWIVTDTDPDSPFYGRTYLTWSRFRSEFGEYRESPIWEAHSDDGGETWSRPHEISGSRAALCDFQVAGPRGECDQNQFSVPTVTPDGTVYVAFQNEQNSELWERGERCTPDTNCESQYLVVSSDDGGKTWSRPTFVVGLEDSGRDYPKNVDGRITLTRYQIRVNSAGNIVADPGSGRLYLVFSDNRAGKHDSAHPVTDTNVYITWSDDGTSWHRPEPVSTRPTDQWFPWVEVDPTNGDIGVIYHDRTREGAYDTTLAEGKPGSWTYTKLTTRTSHPNNSLFFRATAEGCRKCATFHGDYLGLDYGSDGKVNLVWTDMRRLIDVGTANGYTENIFFSRL
jgi:hypothetical protein